MAQGPARSIHEAAGRCAAGLLTDGSTSPSAFPPADRQWPETPCREDSPITVAGPCRNYTGFPILPAAEMLKAAGHRALFCFRHTH